MPDGHYSNLYTVRVVNKTSREIPIELKLENSTGTLQVMSQPLVAPPQKSAETSVLIELDPAAMKPGTTSLVVGVYSHKAAAWKPSRPRSSARATILRSDTWHGNKQKSLAAGHHP